MPTIYCENPDCKKRFYKRLDYNRHLRNCVKTHKCDICGHLERDGFNLDRHINQHQWSNIRPTVRFDDDVIDVFEADDYDRSVDKVWLKRTPKEKKEIYNDLNKFKRSEMIVHENSHANTKYHNTTGVKPKIIKMECSAN